MEESTNLSGILKPLNSSKVRKKMNSQTREILANCNSYSKIYREKLNFLHQHPELYTIRNQNLSKRDLRSGINYGKGLNQINAQL